MPSETKWTRGPWFSTDSVGDYFYIYGAEPASHLAKYVAKAITRNDARLIEAAPDLYKALDNLTDITVCIDDNGPVDSSFVRDVQQRTRIALEALAKARGESPEDSAVILDLLAQATKAGQQWNHTPTPATLADVMVVGWCFTSAVLWLAYQVARMREEGTNVSEYPAPSDYMPPIGPIGSIVSGHPFESIPGNRYCGKCGAGKLHAIHQGGAHAR